MVTTDILQRLLPPRLLQEGDKVPIADFNRLQNRAVVIIEAFEALDVFTQGSSLVWWQDIMCNEGSRAYGREMVQLGIYRPSIIPKALAQAVDEC